MTIRAQEQTMSSSMPTYPSSSIYTSQAFSSFSYSSDDDIPPNHTGPIQTVHPNDVLCGRGGYINAHSGNVYFRTLVNHYRPIYLSPTTGKKEKVKVAEQLITKVRMSDPPGRFLKESPNEKGVWFEIGDFKARKKAGQAMREKGNQSSQVVLKKMKKNVTPTKMNSTRCSSPCVKIQGNITPSPPTSPTRMNSSSSLEALPQPAMIKNENTCQGHQSLRHLLQLAEAATTTMKTNFTRQGNDTRDDIVMKSDNEEEERSLQHITKIDEQTRERLKIALSEFITNSTVV